MTKLAEQAGEFHDPEYLCTRSGNRTVGRDSHGFAINKSRIIVKRPASINLPPWFLQFTRRQVYYISPWPDSSWQRAISRPRSEFYEARSQLDQRLSCGNRFLDIHICIEERATIEEPDGGEEKQTRRKDSKDAKAELLLAACPELFATRHVREFPRVRLGCGKIYEMSKYKTFEVDQLSDCFWRR